MSTILVVDDDTDLLEMVSLVLTNYAIKVNCLSNGNNLLNYISVTKPDMVLMDIFLGELDGRELCRTIKSNERIQYIPVILYSAGQIPLSTIENSLADDFVNKPFDIALLMRKIGLLLNSQSKL